MMMMGVWGGVALGWVFAVGAALGFMCIGMVRGACGVVGRVGMGWDRGISDTKSSTHVLNISCTL